MITGTAGRYFDTNRAVRPVSVKAKMSAASRSRAVLTAKIVETFEQKRRNTSASTSRVTSVGEGEGGGGQGQV